MTSKTPRRLVIGISGASGAIYGIRMLELLKKTDIETHLVMSKSAEMTLVYETDYKPKDIRALASVNHPIGRHRRHRFRRARFRPWAWWSCRARSAP